jgi:DNA-directed RNA polymerase specialized sigma subunit
MAQTAMKPKATNYELVRNIYFSGALNTLKITPTAKLVLIGLLNHYNPNNADMFPSISYLAKQLGISERSISRAIVDLKNAGLILYETKNVNRYRFTSIFFNIANLSNTPCQNGNNDHDKLSNKHVNKPLINNNFKNFKNNFSAVQGIIPKTAEQTKQEINKSLNLNTQEVVKSPYNDKQTAIELINDLHKQNNDISIMIINKLIKHWNFNQDELAFIPKY